MLWKLQINLIPFFVKSEELAANFSSARLSRDVVRNSSFYISQVDQDKIGKMINQLNHSKAKDIFGLDSIKKNVELFPYDNCMYIT